MSEQDKRPVYMGNFERFKKEMQVKHDDVVTQIAFLKRHIKSIYISGIILSIVLTGMCLAI